MSKEKSILGRMAWQDLSLEKKVKLRINEGASKANSKEISVKVRRKSPGRKMLKVFQEDHKGQCDWNRIKQQKKRVELAKNEVIMGPFRTWEMISC